MESEEEALAENLNLVQNGEPSVGKTRTFSVHVICQRHQSRQLSSYLTSVRLLNLLYSAYVRSPDLMFSVPR